MDKNVKRFLPLLLYSFMMLLIINYTCCLNILKLGSVNSANLIIRSVKPCEDVGTEEIKFDLHIRKLSRSDVVLYGTISNKIPLDKNVAIHVFVDVWGNGGWRKNYFIIRRDNACGSLNRLLSRCSTSKANIDCQPDLLSCPLPVGDIECKNITSKLFSDCGLSYVLGKFRIQNAYYKSNKRRGCFELTVEITDDMYKN